MYFGVLPSEFVNGSMGTYRASGAFFFSVGMWLYACRKAALFSKAPTYPLARAAGKLTWSFLGHSAQSFWISPSFWSMLQNFRPSLAPGIARSRAGRVLVGPIHAARSRSVLGL